MSDSSIAQTIDERIEAVKVVVNLIVHSAKGNDLHDLRVLLINTMSLLKRDPGIEAAVDDLYTAAMAVVKDAATGAHASPRFLRILLSALDRFCARLSSAADRLDPEPEMRLKGLEAAYAVQLERVADEVKAGTAEQVA